MTTTSKKRKKKKINKDFYDISISPGQHVCNTIQMGEMMIRFGQGFDKGGGMEGEDDRGPPDSWLQAVCGAISCCLISHFVDVIRRTNTVCSWQGGLKGYPHLWNHIEHNLHTVCYRRNYREMCRPRSVKIWPEVKPVCRFSRARCEIYAPICIYLLQSEKHDNTTPDK